MANVNIKEVEGGQNTAPGLSDGIELDDGTTSKWATLQHILDRITGLTAKTSVTGADTLPMTDSAASNVAKKITITNFLASIFASPTFTGTPTLTGGDFSGMPHDHGDADDGGVLVAAAIAGLHGYALTISSASLAWVDATTYYFGLRQAAPSVSEGTARIYCPRPGTIKIIYMEFIQSVVGSNETFAMSLRKDATSDTSINAAVEVSSNPAIVLNTALNLAVVQGTFLEIKVVTPTWGTNPTGAWNGFIYVQE